MKRPIVNLLAFILAVLCLTGCSSQKETDAPNAPVLEEGTLAAPEASSPETAAAPAPQAAGTRHVTQDITQNLTIDAEAVIPGKTQYSTYTLKRIDGDPDRLFGIFCPEGYGSYQEEPRDDYVVYQESGGKKLVVRSDAVNYNAYDIEQGNHPMQEVANLLNYHTQEHPDARPHDLSFMTVAEMESYGKAILTQLGIAWEPKLSHCVTLSGQEILDFQQEMFGKSHYTEMGQSPQQLTEAKDACYLEFTYACDGIPLFGPGEPSVSFMDGVFPPFAAFATISFNADGLIEADVRYACTADAVSEPQDILTLEEAIAALKSKYDLEILFGQMTTKDIWMEYIPMKQGDNLVLTPYWCFRSVDMEYDDRMGMGDRFNAITGKDLAYGG